MCACVPAFYALPCTMHAQNRRRSANRTGVPGLWQLGISATDGSLERVVAPARGKIADLLKPARYVAPSGQVPVAREQNPDDGKVDGVGCQWFGMWGRCDSK